MDFSIAYRPNPKNEGEPKKYYATPVWNGMIDLDKLAEEISLSTTLTPADVKACIACLFQSLPGHLMAGQAVNCDGFGIFRLSFSAKGGHEKKEDVSAKDIGVLRVLFRANPKLKKRLEETEFSPLRPSKNA